MYTQLWSLVFCPCRLTYKYFVFNHKLNIEICDLTEWKIFFSPLICERSLYLWNFFCLELTLLGRPECLSHWKSFLSDNGIID